MIHNLALSAWENWTAYCVITGHLVAVIWGRIEFNTEDHALILWEGRRDIRRRHVNNKQAAWRKPWQIPLC